MKRGLAILYAALLSLTGCTGQAEPAVVASEAASPSAVESSSESETLDTVASSSEMEDASESVAAASEPEPSDMVESVNEPAVSSATGSPSTAEPSGSAEPAGMPESSSEPVDSSEPEPLSSDPDKIPPGEPVESLTPPPPLTPEQEEEGRMVREEIRLTERAFALSSQVEKILPSDILGGEVGVYQRPGIEVEIPVVDQAAASEILEPYADPEIPFSYRIVELSKSEIERIAADLWEQEIIQKHKDEIDTITPSYWGNGYVITICAEEPIPELDAWLEGYTGAANIEMRYLSNGDGKLNPA